MPRRGGCRSFEPLTSWRTAIWVAHAAASLPTLQRSEFQPLIVNLAIPSHIPEASSPVATTKGRIGLQALGIPSYLVCAFLSAVPLECAVQANAPSRFHALLPPQPTPRQLFPRQSCAAQRLTSDASIFM
jgi:hypothetical protein